MTRKLFVLFLICAGVGTLIALFPTHPALADPYQFQDGLIACWELDETSGTRYDAAGANDLTDNNTVGSSAGVIGNSASFVRTNNEYLSVASNSNLQSGNVDFEIVAWVKFSELNLVSGPLEKYQEYYFQKSSTNFFSFWFGGTQVNGASFGAAVTNTWYFLNGYYDSNADLVGFAVNGETPLTFTNNTGATTNTNPLEVGRVNVNKYLGGNVDLVMIWKGRLLGSTLRSELYNAGSGLSCDSILTAPTATPTPTNTPTPTGTPTPTLTPTPAGTPDGLHYYNLSLSSGNTARVYRSVSSGEAGLTILGLVILVSLTLFISHDVTKDWFK